jgi:hypothetical protein
MVSFDLAFIAKMAWPGGDSGQSRARSVQDHAGEHLLPALTTGDAIAIEQSRSSVRPVVF